MIIHIQTKKEFALPFLYAKLIKKNLNKAPKMFSPLNLFWQQLRTNIAIEILAVHKTGPQ